MDEYKVITEHDIQRLTKIGKVPTKMYGIHFPGHSDFDNIIEILNAPDGSPDAQLVLCKTKDADDIYRAVVDIMNERIIGNGCSPVSCVVVAYYYLGPISLLVYFDYQLDFHTDLLLEVTEHIFCSYFTYHKPFKFVESCHFDLYHIQEDGPEIMDVLLNNLDVDFEGDCDIPSPSVSVSPSLSISPSLEPEDQNDIIFISKNEYHAMLNELVELREFKRKILTQNI
jgi:hypothetical protein